VSQRARRGRAVPPPQQCKPTKAAAQDAITGWLIYHCGGGVLLVPTERCVGPECRGAGKTGTQVLGYAGDLAAGTHGSFTQAGRSIGVTAMDGIEISKGLAAIDQLRTEGTIDAYYASGAKRAYLQQLGEEGERPAPFQEPTALGRVLAPGALGRATRLRPGEDVGPSVPEACGCKPRKFDANDPVSGWGIYYVAKGVLLTPTEKCIGGGGRPEGFWAQTWRNTLALVKPAPPVPKTTEVLPPAPPPAPVPSPVSPPPTTGGYICGTPPGWWPGYVLVQKDPCKAPLIERGRT